MTDKLYVSNTGNESFSMAKLFLLLQMSQAPQQLTLSGCCLDQGHIFERNLQPAYQDSGHEWLYFISNLPHLLSSLWHFFFFSVCVLGLGLALILY